MEKAPLYRSVNTRTHGVRHGLGGEFRHERHAKGVAASDATHLPMHGKHRHGRDYTPLFRFLQSRVGRRWDEVHAEASARLDTPEPIFWLVARRREDGQAMVRTGESSYFSGLFVDDEGLLQRVDPTLNAQDLTPDCRCCTHTLNGVRFGTSS
ncbi:MAG: hypothetical protein E6Q67_15640 [Roseateles sp.]|nr:MAG: hypothetical protein E6Q67_15640 [Roseateles sp.]